MIDRFFKDAVADAADRPAVVIDGEVVNYRELGAKAAMVAQLLAAQIESNPRVALLADNDLHYVIFYWGILLSGGITVELNPELGESEFHAQVENAKPRMIIRVGRHAQRGESPSPGPGQLPVSIDGCTASSRIDPDLGARLSAVLIGGSSAQDMGRWPDAKPDALASIVYTSGTTGQAKGVCLSFDNLSWTTRAIARSLDLEERPSTERFSGNLPLYYTYGKSVLLLATWLHAPIVFTRRVLSPNSLIKLIRDGGVTHLSVVPFQCNLLLKSPGFTAGSLPALRRITVAGGALHDAHRVEMYQRFPRRVLPMYGLSEASTRVACMPVAEAGKRPVSCGRPLPGIEVKVVTKTGQTLPAGEAGEVLVRGPNVMQGYFQDSGASRRVMSGDWLHTGDLGTLDREGYLSITGRLKEIIKIMGESVSARGIEAVINALPQVADVAVIGVPDPKTGEAICAFVVAMDGAQLQADEVRRHCARILGRARVPGVVRFVEELPKTASGKVRKHLLTAG